MRRDVHKTWTGHHTTPHHTAPHNAVTTPHMACRKEGGLDSSLLVFLGGCGLNQSIHFCPLVVPRCLPSSRRTSTKCPSSACGTLAKRTSSGRSAPKYTSRLGTPTKCSPGSSCPALVPSRPSTASTASTERLGAGSWTWVQVNAWMDGKVKSAVVAPKIQ